MKDDCLNEEILTSQWADRGLTLDGDSAEPTIAPLFDPTRVAISTASTIHPPDGGDELHRVIGRLKYAVLYRKSDALQGDAAELFAKRLLLHRLYTEMYGPIADRVQQLKLAVKRDNFASSERLFAELETLLTQTVIV